MSERHDPRTMRTSDLVRAVARAEPSAYDAQMRRVRVWTPWHDECADELDRRVPGDVDKAAAAAKGGEHG